MKNSKARLGICEYKSSATSKLYQKNLYKNRKRKENN